MDVQVSQVREVGVYGRQGTCRILSSVSLQIPNHAGSLMEKRTCLSDSISDNLSFSVCHTGPGLAHAIQSHTNTVQTSYRLAGLQPATLRSGWFLRGVISLCQHILLLIESMQQGGSAKFGRHQPSQSHEGGLRLAHTKAASL